MKKIKLQDLGLNPESILSREQMKMVTGGYKDCHDGNPCFPNEVCCVSAGWQCRLITDPSSPCYNPPPCC